MEALKKVSKFVSKNMAWFAVAVTVIAYVINGSFSSWVGNENVLGGFINTNHLLMLIMCGMGLTLKVSDFAVVFSRPKDILFGELAQFLIMPLLGFLLCLIFQLPPELAVGVILVGCCPGGTSSNVMTYMAGGDVPLSVGMTAVSTILAPFVTPALTGAYVALYTTTAAESAITVDLLSMFIQIIQIVIIPIALGLLVNHFFESFAREVEGILPLISCIGICLIIGFVIDSNSDKLFANGLLVIVVVILHNMCGYALGFLLGYVLKLSSKKRNAISIEVGMQNSGLATTLAGSCFPSLALATVPGAIFSAWHNISGAIVANLMKAAQDKEAEKETVA